MSTKGSSYHFDPTLMLKSILGDLERKLNKSVQLMHKRLDRIENESLKRRGSIQSNRAKMSNHEFHTLKEEMGRDRSKSVYEKYKHTCDDYKEDQRRKCQTSKKGSFSTKSACSFEKSHNHTRAVEHKSSRNWSTHGELKEERLIKREKEPNTSISSKSKDTIEPSKEE